MCVSLEKDVSVGLLHDYVSRSRIRKDRAPSEWFKQESFMMVTRVCVLQNKFLGEFESYRTKVSRTKVSGAEVGGGEVNAFSNILFFMDGDRDMRGNGHATEVSMTVHAPVACLDTLLSVFADIVERERVR